MDTCTDKPLISSAEWSLSTALCVSLPNQGVTFGTGPADPGFHTLNLFGQNRRKNKYNFSHVFCLPEVIWSSSCCTLERGVNSAAPFSVKGIYKWAGMLEWMQKEGLGDEHTWSVVWRGCGLLIPRGIQDKVRVTRSSGRCLSPWQGGGSRWPLRSLPPQTMWGFMILKLLTTFTFEQYFLICLWDHYLHVTVPCCVHHSGGHIVLVSSGDVHDCYHY